MRTSSSHAASVKYDYNNGLRPVFREDFGGSQYHKHKYCYNCKGGRPRHETSRRGSIPQAVSTVANKMLEEKEPEDFWIISILQAIGTFTLFFSFSPPFGQGLEMCGPHRRFSAISHPSSHIASGKYCCNSFLVCSLTIRFCNSFNTASGKYCCNDKSVTYYVFYRMVSIPQAVSTVATVKTKTSML